MVRAQYTAYLAPVINGSDRFAQPPFNLALLPLPNTKIEPITKTP
jgi:hypothetical protein